MKKSKQTKITLVVIASILAFAKVGSVKVHSTNIERLKDVKSITLVNNSIPKLTNKQLKEKAKAQVEIKKYAISYLSGGYDSFNKTNELFEEYEEYIDKEAYNDGYLYIKEISENNSSKEKRLKYEFETIKEKWYDYTTGLKYPYLKSYKFSTLVGQVAGKEAALNDNYNGLKSDYHSKYEKIIDDDYYSIAYQNLFQKTKNRIKKNESKEKIKEEIAKESLEIQFDFDNYIKRKDAISDAYLLYYTALECGYIDEMSMIKGKDKLVGVPRVSNNKNSKEMVYLGYYNGSDKRDKDYVNNLSKKR